MDEKDIEEMERIFINMKELSTPDELPNTFAKNCTNIWKAFRLGRQFERI